ncbi:MAG: MFS transporter [Pseudomonadota bacterium]|nr:MFS transporter [Pseudomonadota bacterium]
MASICMVAIEATIVSTAMPQIVADLGGLRLYSWVFSAFLLTQTALTVVFGNLSDIYGRKPVMLGGIAIFVLGSILAGFAWSMPSMIVFRLVQGAGAAAMQPVAMTIVADLYPARERGKIQGYLASVWAISALLGPVVGGLIVRNVSWAWVFWINVPIRLIAAAGFSAFLHENVQRERRTIDVAGATAFAIAVTSLLICLAEVGTSDFALLSAAGAVSCIATVAFILQERRTDNPMVSFALWRRRPIAAANGVCLLSGMALMGLTTFVPIYVQIVLRRSPLIAGLALTTVLVGWPAGATLATRLFHRVGLHHLLLTGALLLPVGAVTFVLLTPQSSPVMAGLGSLVMGFGMGLLSISSLVLIQEIVDSSQRGSATASNLFSRNLGSTLGAAVLGAVLNHGLARATGGTPVTSDQLRQLIEMPPAQIPGDAVLRLALQHSLNLTFWAMLAMAVIAAVIASMVPLVELKRATPVAAE